jgi:hypothetical protein
MTIRNTTLTSNASSILTSSGGETAIVSTYFCNPTAGNIDVTVYAVASGDTAGISNKIYSNLTITANDTYVLDAEKIILGSGDAVFAEGDGIIATVVFANI